MRRRFVLAATLLGVVSCANPSWDDPGPRESFEAFLNAGFRGEREVVFQAILPEDRKTLTSALKTFDDLPESVQPEPADMLVIAGLDTPYDVARLKLKEPLEKAPETGQTVVIEIHYTQKDRAVGRVDMVWSGEEWFVDLPLEDTPVEPAKAPVEPDAVAEPEAVETVEAEPAEPQGESVDE